MEKKIKLFFCAVLAVIMLTAIVEWNHCDPNMVTRQHNTEQSQPDCSGVDCPSADQFKVPNIVHYNWFTTEKRQFYFKHWISVLSAHKVLKPDKILIHYNMAANGSYWDRITSLSRVYLVKQDMPDSLLGEKVVKSDFFTAPSNIGRIKALLETGGIYLDFDVVVVQSFDELRKYPCTLGYETPSKPCGGIIICAKDSPFLYLWANSFLDDYRPDVWAYNTGLKAGTLAERFPHLIHREMHKLHRPNFYEHELNKIWGNDTWNWHQNYAVHTWYRKGLTFRKAYFQQNGVPDQDNIWTMNNTYGEICRHILKLPSNNL